MTDGTNRPRVVVVGAGFGGLAAVKRMRDLPVDVVLLDAHNYHLFQPLLYQVASGLLDPSQIAHPIRGIVRDIHNCEVRMATVTGVDLEGRRLHTDAGECAYDMLVLATGSISNFFGNQELAGTAIGLKSLDDALRLRGRVLRAIEQAAITSDAQQRRRLLTFAIVGGGATGVEYAGALSELVAHVLPQDFPQFPRSAYRIVLVEGGTTVLPAFATRLRAAAAARLRRSGVELLIGHTVASGDASGITLASGRRVDCATVIWTAGVRAQPLATALTDSPVSLGRVVTTPSLALPGHPEVFVIGDLATQSGRREALPMLAPVAIQQGAYVAEAISARLAGSAPPAAFRYRDKGIMATIGRNMAVVQMGPLRLAGFVGWLVWLFVHLVYIIGFRNRVIVLVNWGWNYLFYDRPVRLITGAVDVPADQHHSQEIQT